MRSRKDEMRRNGIIEGFGYPINCYFCGREIIRLRGQSSESLVLHSLDRNNENWNPENKAPTHRRCHTSYHTAGTHHTEETKQKMRGPRPSMTGEKNHNYGKHHSTETREKIRLAIKENWKSRRKRYGSSGMND